MSFMSLLSCTDTSTADSAVVTGPCPHGLRSNEHSRKLKWSERQRCTVRNIKYAQGKDTFVCLTHGITPDCTEVLRSLMDGADVHSWMVRFKTSTSAELMPDRPDPTDREAILAFFRQTPSNTWYHQCDLGLEPGSGGTGTVKPYKTLFESWAPAGSLKDLMTPDGPGTSDNVDTAGPSSVRLNPVSPDYELQL